MGLSPRQEKILISVIEEYIQKAEPVGSKELVEKYNLPFSSATLRSEMANLELEGYLFQPHISAGRIPTDKGYRFFVNYLTEMRLEKINREEQMRLEEELIKLRVREKMMARTLAKLLSSFSQNLAITGLIEEKEFFESGIKSLLSQPDYQNFDEICKMAELIDYLDENIEYLISKTEPKKVETFIGKESLFTENCDCAIVISQCTLPHGDKGIIAILGPKRMEYKKNISLIQCVSNFLEERYENNFKKRRK